MARQNVAIVKKSDEQDPDETLNGKTGPAADRAGESGTVPEKQKPAAEAASVRLVDEQEESGLTLAPEALRRLVAAEEERREIIREFIARNLKSSTDYGTVTSGGRESKPSLFKPGAEKICLLFQLRPRFIGDKATLAMAGNRPGLFAYICRLVDPAGRIVGEGRGAADVNERDGWTVNNAIKIAEKRAQVDAVLRVAGLSEIFTQDLEDMSQRVALEHEGGSYQSYGSRGDGEPARSRAPEAPTAAGPTYIAEAPPTAPTSETAAESEAPASEPQQRAIRALLPRVGLSEDELLARLKIDSLDELTADRAVKMIDWLKARERKRTQQS